MQPAANTAIHHRKVVGWMDPAVSWHWDNVGSGMCHQHRVRDNRGQWTHGCCLHRKQLHQPVLIAIYHRISKTVRLTDAWKCTESRVWPFLAELHRTHLLPYRSQKRKRPLNYSQAELAGMCKHASHWLLGRHMAVCTVVQLAQQFQPVNTARLCECCTACNKPHKSAICESSSGSPTA